jgi:hypothetical protein
VTPAAQEVWAVAAITDTNLAEACAIIAGASFLDVTSGETVAGSLSMPHLSRLHRG